MNKTIVLKYGGTSVASPYRLKQAADYIINYKKKGYNVVVIVSAMGSTTDYLMSLSKEITDNPPKRELDMLLTTGERITMSLLSMAIQSKGYSSISFTGSQVGIITSSEHTSAKIEEIKGDRLIAALKEDNIAIVAGFQGVSREKEITTLGRGGSDTTAVAIAAFLEAETCEIITDVDGIFTANPTIVKNASKINEISYEETIEMASFGAQILHPRAVEIAYKYNIPIKVKSLIKEGEGTMVKHIPIQEGPVVKAITYQENLRIFRIENASANGFAHILKEIMNNNIKISHFIQGKEDHATLIVEKQFTDKLKKLLDKFSTYTIIENIYAISVIGNGIGSSSDILNKVLTNIDTEKALIHSISLSPLRLTLYITIENNYLNNLIEHIAENLNLAEGK